MKGMMNRKFSTSKHLFIAAVTVVLLLLTASCSMMHDDREGCVQELRVTFSYDMNMKFADAFANEVKAVSLYAYDTGGRLAFHRTEPVADLLKRGGYMTLDGVAPGHYTLLVWAEGENRYTDSYLYTTTSDASQNITRLDCRVNRSGRELPHDLTPLYHGMMADADLTLSGYGVKTVNVPLTKNTNNIRVVLQNASGEPLHTGDFSFSIDDDNTWLAYDNAPLADDSVTYRPWSQYDGTTRTVRSANAATLSDADTKISAVVAELTVNRLLVSKHPRLKVRDTKDGKTVFSIPLIDYALLVKGRYHATMSDQEYLDRQDDYDFIFFIDDDHNWLSASIVVNSWRVVLQNTDI